jgi:uncharacterized protein
MKIVILFFLIISSNIILAQEKHPLIEKANLFLHYLNTSSFQNAVVLFDFRVSYLPDAKLLERTWEGVLLHSGSFMEVVNSKIDSLAGNNFVTTTCVFEKLSLDFRVSFNSFGEINNIVFLPSILTEKYVQPDYVKRRKFKEVQVYFKAGDFLIPGTLSIPKCGRKIPLVILVHGTGPMDRDNSVGASKMFKDLAWGLSSKRVAVLRYDKRTYVYAARISEYYGDKFTVNEEIVIDALAAAEFGKTIKRIDVKKIIIAGHGMGGTIAPRIINMKPELAGIIVMAGFARPYEDLILDQARYLGRVTAINSIYSEPISFERLERQVAMVKNPLLSLETPSSELPLNLSSKYWLDLKNYNQISSARNVKRKIFFLHGENDQMVSITDFSIWKNGLKHSKNASFKLYDNVNHYFIETDFRKDNNDNVVSGSVPYQVLIDVLKWIKEK